MKLNKYKMGWIGIRANKIGKAARILKATGWIKLGHAEPTNRNGFDRARPGRTKDQFSGMDWSKLKAAGLDGVAVWITDAQWGTGSAITDTQWHRQCSNSVNLLRKL